ncbi:MAG TPA: aminoacyl-tRNA hydrolase [Candidatus Saccharimonadales bacterium]|nr:aminoacyl-tRNA hydrolase [Candidatus Saccharimonadales bacterium]
MALFVKNPNTNDNKPLFTVGLSKTFLVVGLGNPGDKYDLTRHNVGFFCSDYMVESNDQMSDWVNKKDLKCHFSSGNLGDTRLIVIKPQTFMNSSGESVLAVTRFFNVPMNNVLVVHDDLDINFGQIRSRVGGSSAGHNGVQSIMDLVGESFGRIRVGIGPLPEKFEKDKFVLSKFNSDQTSNLEPLKKEVNSLAMEFIYGGQINAETRSFLI